MGRDGPHGSCGKKALKLSHIHHQLSAVCGEMASTCSFVFNWVRSFNNGKETVQAAVREWYRNTLISDSVKPCESSQGDGSHV